MTIRFKKMSKRAKAPAKAHPSDAGFDLTAVSADYHNGLYTYGTGVAVEIPEGYMGLVFPRSSISNRDLALTNSVGVIDFHYRGEIFVKFRTTGRPYIEKPLYEMGERIAQLVVIPIPDVEFEEAEELSETDRGEGGYGSTGE